MNIKHTRGKFPKILVAIALIFVTTVGGVVAYYLIWELHPIDQSKTINYSEATEEEKQAAEDHKKDISDNIDDKSSNDEQTSSNDKKSVTPFITAWGQASAGNDFKLNGFVPGIIETDGKCTLTMTKGDKKATKTRVALADAKSTTCGQTVIPYGDLEPGEWKAVLSYSSSRSSGSSEVTSVEVK